MAITVRATRGVVVTAAVALVVSAASSAAANQQGGQNDPPRPSRLVVATAHPVTASDAVSAAAQLDLDLIGLRQQQPGLEGEAYISESYPVEEYIADFNATYGTQPAIVGLVLEAPDVSAPTSSNTRARTSSTEALLGDELAEATSRMPVFTPPPTVAPAGLQQARERAAAGPLQSRTFSAFSTSASVAEKWAPNYSEIAAVTNFEGKRVIQTYNNWDLNSGAGHDPRLMPEDWGFEFDVSLFNPNRTGTQPLCSGEGADAFWATRAVRSWTVYTSASATLGSYLDFNNVLDACGRVSLAIGIGYPRNIPVSPSAEMITRIVADAGTKTSSRFGAVIQGVSNDCNNLGFAPNTDCMDLNIGRAFPGPGSKTLQVVNQTRNWSVPNCTYTDQGFSVDQAPDMVPYGCQQF